MQRIGGGNVVSGVHTVKNHFFLKKRDIQKMTLLNIPNDFPYVSDHRHIAQRFRHYVSAMFTRLAEPTVMRQQVIEWWIACKNRIDRVVESQSIWKRMRFGQTILDASAPHMCVKSHC